MSNNEMIQLLLLIAVLIFFIAIGLLGFYFYLRFKTIKAQETKSGNEKGMPVTSKSKTKAVYKEYTKQSIKDFMEFDKIVDNMICQKNGFRYLMVINCQGVNYDLMSSNEKLSVEQGFVEFLNTLRHPIQIYTQTRTVNLENSISNYKARVKEEEEKLNKMKFNYEQMSKSGQYTKQQLQGAFFELTKQSNLCEYGRDIIANTERMSLNKNVLNKQYYIIVPYYPSELGSNSFDKEEIQNIAFSELYTRAQSIARALSTCGVDGKVMNSNELVDLLYMAYNRDEAEVFGLNKILKMGYDELYSTAPDIIDKKTAELDNIINERAFELAQQKVYEVKSEKQRKYEAKEKTLEELIDETALLILDENEEYLGEEVVKKAKSKIKKEKTEKEGETENEETKRTRRKKRTV